MKDAYLIISIIIGFIVIFDGYILYFKTPGFITTISGLTSTVEFVWAVVSIVALFKLNFTGLQILIPSVYVAHNVFGWIYGVVAYKSNTGAGEDVVIPAWYALFGMIFGIVFTILCLIIVSDLYFF